MKKLRLSIILLLLSLLSSRKSDAQTIEYDFSHPDTLSGILPFDRKFTIKFTHIDTAKVSFIVVRIYEVGVTNYKKVLKQAGYRRSTTRNATSKITITNNDIIKAEGRLIISPDTLIKYVHFADSTAFMTSRITLRPSSDYFFEINTIESTTLSEKERKIVTRNIRKDPEFTKLINGLAYENIKDPDIASDTLNDFSRTINAIVGNVVRKTNAQYYFLPVDISRQLGDFYTGMANVGVALKDISEILKTVRIPDSITKIIRDSLLKTDWVNIDKNSTNYKKITETVKKQKDALAAGQEVGVAERLDVAMKDMDKAIDKIQITMDTLISKTFVDRISKGTAMTSTYPKEFLKQAGEFIRSDLGLAYVWGIGRVNPYVAAQISLGPLDDSIPLREYKGFGNVMRSRLSFMIGISVDAVAKDSVRRGLIGSQALILGTGFKLWQWLKLNSGFYLYYSEPKNPLQDRSRLSFKGSPFVSLSIDIRIQSLLNGVGNAIFKTQTP